MPGTRADPDAPRIGLVVNPIAGLGGRVGLKGTDGVDTAARAIALGAEPRAIARAASALASLDRRWGSRRPRPVLLTGDGDMGKAAADAAGYPSVVVGGRTHGATTSADTHRLAQLLMRERLDLLLFAGGDGTARDIWGALDGTLTTLGIPAGVKIGSAVFATSPLAAGELAAEHLASPTRPTVEGEVLDLDEAAYQLGQVLPRLHGYLRVPQGRMVQSRKTPSPVRDATAMRAVAAEIVGGLVGGQRYILGPGTTIRAIAERLGLPKTLVGIDVIVIEPDGPRLLVADATERDLIGATAAAPGTSSIVVTPIGGQGFLFGRGNQPISPSVIRAVGRERVVVVATPSKLVALGGRPLLADTGEAALDRELSGYVRVVTGLREAAIVRVEAA